MEFHVARCGIHFQELVLKRESSVFLLEKETAEAFRITLRDWERKLITPQGSFQARTEKSVIAENA